MKVRVRVFYEEVCFDDDGYGCMCIPWWEILCLSMCYCLVGF